MPISATIRVRELGRVDYEPTLRAMRAQTDRRGPETPDELWLLEHPPVFTTGLRTRREHLRCTGDIPVIPVDRGGQATYHGPGQVVLYSLIDLRRRRMGIRRMVSALEDATIQVLDGYGIRAHARRDAPGVYVGHAKIASVGLRVRRGCSYHGIAFNVAMDLEPFNRIDPCGYPGLRVTDLRTLGVGVTPTEAARTLADALIAGLPAAPETAPAAELG